MSDSIIIRRMKLNDILLLTNEYCNLSPTVKKLFHPFPFDTKRAALIFFVLWINGSLLPLFKRILPKMAGDLVVAFDKNKLAGFALFSVTKKEGATYVANAGIIILEEFQGKGVAQRAYDLLIKYAKAAGITKFQITIMERNISSLIFHKKIGYVDKGYTDDEVWDGKHEKNLKLELEL